MSIGENYCCKVEKLRNLQHYYNCLLGRPCMFCLSNMKASIIYIGNVLILEKQIPFHLTYQNTNKSVKILMGKPIYDIDITLAFKFWGQHTISKITFITTNCSTHLGYSGSHSPTPNNGDVLYYIFCGCGRKTFSSNF